jgi:hypothetical protein
MNLEILLLLLLLLLFYLQDRNSYLLNLDRASELSLIRQCDSIRINRYEFMSYNTFDK